MVVRRRCSMSGSGMARLLCDKIWESNTKENSSSKKVIINYDKMFRMIKTVQNCVNFSYPNLG